MFTSYIRHTYIVNALKCLIRVCVSGAMLVRSSPHMLAFYHKWLFDMVESSEGTDQKLLMRLFSEQAQQSFSCNPLANDIFNFSNNPSGSGRNISYCFLNELLFQVPLCLLYV